MLPLLETTSISAATGLTKKVTAGVYGAIGLLCVAQAKQE